jgi:hypothetical protein
VFFVQNANKSSFFKENPVFLGPPSYITCRLIGKFFMLIMATLPSTLILYM